MSRGEGGGLPTLLVVDDEPLNRDLLRRMLQRDYHIVEASDGEAALEELDRGPVDILLCDQAMPGLSGTELAREVRKRYPGTVALLLTGYEDAPEVHEAQREGVLADVVGKPWIAAELKAALVRARAGAR